MRFPAGGQAQQYPAREHDGGPREPPDGDAELFVALALPGSHDASQVDADRHRPGHRPALELTTRITHPGKHRGRLLRANISPALTWTQSPADTAELTNPSPIPGIRHGKGALGRRGWAGPMPPRSHGPRAYAFQLFALDQAPGLPVSFTLDDVIAAIKGHAIDRARLDGTYEIR